MRGGRERVGEETEGKGRGGEGGEGRRVRAQNRTFWLRHWSG